MIQNTNIKVSLTPELRLEQALKEAGIKDTATVTRLTVLGTIAKDDCRYIRKNMGKTLRELDMGNSSANREIECEAFQGCTGLISVVVPDSIEYIAVRAFEGCTGLVSVNIPASVTEIEYRTFYGCYALTSITAHPDNPEFVSENGILYTKDKSKLIEYPAGRKGDYFVPDSVTYVNFNGCPGLTGISAHPDNPKYASENGVLFNKDKTKLIAYPAGRHGDYFIPDSVTEIEHFAFGSCIGLTSVTIPDSIKKIESNNFLIFKGIEGDTFSGCNCLTSITANPNNPKYASENGVLFNKRKTKLLAYPAGRQGDYVIPDSVTKIEDRAFVSCFGLTSITIPNSVTKIISFDCPVLTSIIVHPENTVFSGENGVIFNKDKTELIQCPQGWQGDYVIPDSVKKIGKKAFSGCSGLTSVIIPDSVKKIGEEAFSGCSGLISITISASVTEIENRTFYDCSGLISVTIPASVKKIGFWAFGGCTGLASVVIPDSVVELESTTFRGCTGLTAITVQSDNPVFASIDGILFNKEKTNIILFPSGRQGNNIIPDSITEIVYSSSSSPYYGIQSLIIPATVAKIGKYAFRSNGLTSINIAESVTEIENLAFNDCYDLLNIMVHPDNAVYTNENGVLFNKNKTELIKYPQARTEKHFVIPDSVKIIGDGAFSGCYDLSSIHIPESVTIIGNCAFEHSGIKSVAIPNSVTDIGESAFYCSALTSINIPDGITEIGGFTFFESKLKSISIPASVTKIGKKAFYYCGLTSLTMTNSVTEIGNSAFEGSSSLKSLTVFDSVTKKERWSFSECDGLNISELVADNIVINSIGTDIENILVELHDIVAINVHPDNQVYASENGVLFNKDKTELIAFPYGLKCDYTIPASVKKIGKYAFYCVSKLENVTIPASVIEIDKTAFVRATPNVTVHPDNSVYKSVNGKIRRKRKKTIHQKERIDKP